MKKLILTIFLVIVSFLINKNNAQATVDLICDYQGTSEYNVALRGFIEINSDGNLGEKLVSHYTNNPLALLNSSEEILNWDSSVYEKVDVGYSGKAPYLNAKEKKCPEYMVYVFLSWCSYNCEKVFVSSGDTTVTKMIGILSTFKRWSDNAPIVTPLKLVASTVPEPEEDDKGGSILGQIQGPNGEIDFCEDAGVLKAAKIAGYIIYIIKILVPLALILFGSIDFVKAIVESDPSNIKKSGISLAKRAIAGVIIFFIPTIISLTLSLITSFDKNKNNVKTDYKRCYKCVEKPYNC